MVMVRTSLLQTSVRDLAPRTTYAPAPPAPSPTNPPTMAMLPSADSATDVPWRALLVLTSFLPSCVQPAGLMGRLPKATFCGLGRGRGRGKAASNNSEDCKNGPIEARPIKPPP